MKQTLIEQTHTNPVELFKIYQEFQKQKKDGREPIDIATSIFGLDPTYPPDHLLTFFLSYAMLMLEKEMEFLQTIKKDETNAYSLFRN